MLGIRHIEITCTTCSPEKDEHPEPMPAYKRYSGKHIAQTRAQAGRRPFYILSGVYGLIPADYKIRYYNYLLERGRVDALVALVALQIMRRKIRTIRYYHDPSKMEWSLYSETLERATNLRGTTLIHMMLPTPKEVAAAPPQAADAPASA